MDILIAVLVFVSVVLLLTGIAYYASFVTERRKLISKIQNADEEELSVTIQDDEGESAVKKLFLSAISFLGAYLKPKKEDEISSIRKKFLKAGLRKHNAPLIFFGFKAFFAFVLVSCVFLLKIFVIKAIPNHIFIFLSVLMALIGFYLPEFWLRIKTDRRREQILLGFPDALDLMVVCVEAGMGLDAAINRVGEEMQMNNKVLSDEFKLMSLELRAGKTRQDALRNLAMRTDLEDVSSLMTLLIQTDKFGTSVAQALRVYSDTMRTKRFQRAEEMAAKLPVKLLFPLILFIFPSLFVVILGPAAIRIYRVLLPKLGGQ